MAIEIQIVIDEELTEEQVSELVNEMEDVVDKRDYTLIGSSYEEV